MKENLNSLDIFYSTYLPHLFNEVFECLPRKNVELIGCSKVEITNEALRLWISNKAYLDLEFLTQF